MNGKKEKNVQETNFPLVVKKGSIRVKIYRTTNRGTPLFTVSFIAAHEGRKLRQFRSFDRARFEAGKIADDLAAGDLQSLKMTGADRSSLIEAKKFLMPSGASVVTAAHAYAAAFNILGGDRMIEAARFYKAKVDTAPPLTTVSEAVAKYVAAKSHENLSRHHANSSRLILVNGLAAAFKCNLTSVTADALRDYLNAKKVGPVTRDNHRAVIAAFFHHAKDHGWLPKNETTAAEAIKPYRAPQKDVQIFKPEEVTKLLAHATEDFLPWIALIAFGGLRNEELAKGLQWSAIDFTKNTLVVPGVIAKTKRKRKIELPTNLAAWLAPYRGSTGPIFDTYPHGRIVKTAEAAGVTWKRNALRHSFGSYRMESVKNAGQVALEMGNSPAVVLKHYHEIVDASDATAYWSIAPQTAENVVLVRGRVA